MKKYLLVVLMLVTAGILQAQEKRVHYFRFHLDSGGDEKARRFALDTLTRMLSIDNVRGDTVYAYALDGQLNTFKMATGYEIIPLPLPGSRDESLKMTAQSLDRKSTRLNSSHYS